MALIKSISGIRGTIGGKAGEGLSPLDVVKFTAAFGTWIIRQGKPERKVKVVVGRDARISGEMVNRLERMMLDGQCSFEGQRPRRFSIDINYAVMLDSQGNATQIVVEDVGCRPLELMVGQIAAGIVRGGHIRTAPPAEPTLYASRINFNLS